MSRIRNHGHVLLVMYTIFVMQQLQADTQGSKSMQQKRKQEALEQSYASIWEGGKVKEERKKEEEVEEKKVEEKEEPDKQ